MSHGRTESSLKKCPSSHELGYTASAVAELVRVRRNVRTPIRRSSRSGRCIDERNVAGVRWHPGEVWASCLSQIAGFRNDGIRVLNDGGGRRKIFIHVVTDDDAVVHGTQPAGHNNSHGTGVEQTTDLLWQIFADL